jgi:hypothetical protein
VVGGDHRVAVLPQHQIMQITALTIALVMVELPIQRLIKKLIAVHAQHVQETVVIPVVLQIGALVPLLVVGER